ncbi:MAG TPA: hypothetical protein VK745_10150 [Polyangiaceae bacterium]|jgi:hypothetical protein|nr:hypothetical protein [Polyangiaceae bacterium]
MSPAPSSASLSDDASFEQRFSRVEGLLAELAHSRDPMLERATREILAAVLELHRRGLERLLEIAARANDTREALAADPRVSAMLLLHGLHPIPLSERVSRTLGTLRERYRSKVERIDFEENSENALLVRVVPAPSACQSTRETLKKDLENALIAAAPDVSSLVIEIQEAPPALITLRVRPDAAGERALGGSR